MARFKIKLSPVEVLSATRTATSRATTSCGWFGGLWIATADSKALSSNQVIHRVSSDGQFKITQHEFIGSRLVFCPGHILMQSRFRAITSVQIDRL